MIVSLSAAEVNSFQETINGNYFAAGRSFPWRKTVDPYAILVSEMMLQQTQTVRVIPKYAAWLEHFPDLRTLAAASLPDVLSYWSGLGYNRRALYLQQTCRLVCEDYGGIFPDNPEELEHLPGIGLYTSRAVATFAFNRPEVFVETNIRSVFIFFFFQEHTGKVSDTDILPLVSATMDREQPRQWYYALMDYGADLKKKVVNPGRQSRHYIKQSPFKGSIRQARGAILRQLTKNGTATLEQISSAENIDIYRLSEAAHLLERDQLVCGDGTTYGVYHR